MYISKQKWSIS